MKQTRKILTSVLIVIFCLCLLTGCSAKKAEPIQIFSDAHSEEYQNAASEYFSSVGWSVMDFLDSPVSHEETKDDVTITHTFGGVSADTRYVVIISQDETVLTRTPVDGSRYTVCVYDNDSGDITMSVLYRVGTTENCVTEGNVIEGEMSFTKTVDISAAGITDTAERAGMIFDALYEILVEIEGK